MAGGGSADPLSPMSPGKAATYENREATEVERAVEEKWGEGGALLSRLANTEECVEGGERGG